MSKKTILITGGAGFIGSHLSEYFVKQGMKVVVLDDLSTGFEKNIEHLYTAQNFEFIRGSITDAQVCARACEGVDIVLHHAALGSVPRSIENPIRTNEVNVGGFVNMLTAAKNAGVEKFIYASSSSVYGDDTTTPKTESRTGNLLSPYSVSKYTNERYAAVFSALYGIKTIGFRYFNVFGERQNPQGAYAAVITKFIAALQEGKQPEIYGTGNNTRDFTYVANVVHANALCVQKTDLPENLVINIACGGTISVNAIFEAVAGRLESALKPVYKPERRGEIKDSYANISMANSVIGYEPVVSVEEGLIRTVSWFQEKLVG